MLHWIDSRDLVKQKKKKSKKKRKEKANIHVECVKCAVWEEEAWDLFLFARHEKSCWGSQGAALLYTLSVAAVRLCTRMWMGVCMFALCKVSCARSVANTNKVCWYNFHTLHSAPWHAKTQAADQYWVFNPIQFSLICTAPNHNESCL